MRDPLARRRFLKAATLIAVPWPTVARADYPTRPITLIVPGAAGGSADAVARIIQVPGQTALGKPLVIEARNGAGGVVGTMDVVHAAPDGYTLLLASLGTHVLGPLLMANPPFDTLRDLTPITKLLEVPGIILATPELPVRDLAGLITLAHSSKEPLAYGTPGITSTGHLIAQLLCERTGIRLLHIPYNSTPQSLVDLMTGRISLAFNLVTGVEGHVRSGKIRAIAVTGAHRVAAFPEVPTVQESGVADFDVVSWYGMMAPARTPWPVVDRVHRAMVQALQAADVRKRYEAIGAEVVGNSPAEFAQQIPAEIRLWVDVVRAARIAAE